MIRGILNYSLSSPVKQPETRAQAILRLFPKAPKFRLKQLKQALFDAQVKGWEDVTTLSKDMRETLVREEIPFLSLKLVKQFESKDGDTYKAVLRTADKRNFETVLMANRRGQWTICVSSQIGCAMKCTFCATGTMGLTRSLTADEIVDQYRYWQQFLAAKPELPQRISNVVFMGMGEPLANYDNLKETIHTWLEYTDMGPTKITVSTVGILAQMKRLLVDPEWPPVKIAVSLHSANQKRREEIVPTTIPNFVKDLAAWSHEYHRLKGNRNHHITYEYTLITGENDTPELAKELASYIKKTAVSKVNVIPYNPVAGKSFTQSSEERIEHFKQILKDNGVDVTQRRTMGDDIDAACGQLALSTSE